VLRTRISHVILSVRLLVCSTTTTTTTATTTMQEHFEAALNHWPALDDEAALADLDSERRLSTWRSHTSHTKAQEWLRS